MASSRIPNLHKKDGYWYLVRRVPLRFARFDKRGIVRISTRVRVGDDPRGIVGGREAARLDAELSRYWTDLAEGRVATPVKKAEWAAKVSAQYGFPCVEREALDAGPLIEMVKRCLAVEALGNVEKGEVSSALWGHFKKPETGLLLSELVAAYEEMQATALVKKSEEQLRSWRRPRELAVKVFIEVLRCDKEVAKLTLDDVDALRDHWKNRVLEEEVEVHTANKNIGRVAAMFRELNRERKLRLPDIFAGSRLKGGTTGTRVPFAIDYVQNVLLGEGVMAGLNDEARAIFYVVAESGMRPSEVAGLTRATIRLDHDIPHVKLVEVGRKLKNKSSIRSMPLVGVALEVMRFFPDGFPHYRTRTASLSSAVSKYLRENNLCPVEGQAFYSLRHTFKDRLVEATEDDELRDLLMGHTTRKERYGDQEQLKRKRDVLLRVAFKAPKLAFAEACAPEVRDHLCARALRQPRAGGRWSHKVGRVPPKVRQQRAMRAQAVQEGSFLKDRHGS